MSTGSEYADLWFLIDEARKSFQADTNATISEEELSTFLGTVVKTVDAVQTISETISKIDARTHRRNSKRAPTTITSIAALGCTVFSLRMLLHGEPSFYSELASNLVGLVGPMAVEMITVIANGLQDPSDRIQAKHAFDQLLKVLENEATTVKELKEAIEGFKRGNTNGRARIQQALAEFRAHDEKVTEILSAGKATNVGPDPGADMSEPEGTM